MAMKLNHFMLCCCLGAALTLSACLPGKEEEKKVIVQLDDAIKTVSAEKAATDLSEAARTMQNFRTPLSTNDLIVRRCADISDRFGVVFAYVPATAKITKSGVLPAPIAQRMRAELLRGTSVDMVSNSSDIANLRYAAVGDTNGDTKFIGDVNHNGVQDGIEDIAFGASFVTCVQNSITAATGTIALNSPILVQPQNFAMTTAADKLADKLDTLTDKAPVTEVTTAKCENRQPGLTASFDGEDSSAECGKAAPTDEDVVKLAVSDVTLPDWKKRLTATDATGEGATENFSCIVTEDNDCQLITPNIRPSIVCDDDTATDELISNPIIDNGISKRADGSSYYNKTYAELFMPSRTTVNSGNCGNGWTGDIVARVKKRDCKVIRNDSTLEVINRLRPTAADGSTNNITYRPATVLDVAYVGVKCRKEEIMRNEACPATGYSDPIGPDGATIQTQGNPSGRVMSDNDARLTGVLALQPTYDAVKKQNISSIAYSNPSGTKNILADIAPLINTDPTVYYSNSTDRPEELQRSLLKPPANAADDPSFSTTFFNAWSDLSAVPKDDFDDVFFDEMNALGRLRREKVTCYTEAQQCRYDFNPSLIDVLVDRSDPMAEKTSRGDDVRLPQQETVCSSTLSAVFYDTAADSACTAVKGLQGLLLGAAATKDYSPERLTASVAASAIDAGKPIELEVGTSTVNAVQIGGERYELNAPYRALAYTYYRTIFNSLKDNYYQDSAQKKTFWDHTLRTLLRNKNCSSGGPLVDGLVSADMLDVLGWCEVPPDAVFPSLAQAAASRTRTAGSAPVPAPQQVYKSCQITCPGTCVTRIKERSLTSTPLADVSAKAVRDYAIPKMPLTSKVTYGEILRGKTDGQGGAPTWQKPVTLMEGLNLTAEELAKIDPNRVRRAAQQRFDAKVTTRNANNKDLIEDGDKNAIGGGTALFRGIDTQIDRLRNAGLNGDRLKHSALIVFGGMSDGECVERKSGLFEDILMGVFSSMIAGLGGLTMNPAMITFGTAGIIMAIDKAFDSGCKVWYKSGYFDRNLCEPEPLVKKYQCNACVGHYNPATGVCLPRFYGKWYQPWKVVTRSTKDIPSDEEIRTLYGYASTGSRAQWCRDVPSHTGTKYKNSLQLYKIGWDDKRILDAPLPDGWNFGSDAGNAGDAIASTINKAVTTSKDAAAISGQIMTKIAAYKTAWNANDDATVDTLSVQLASLTTQLATLATQGQTSGNEIVQVVDSFGELDYSFPDAIKAVATNAATVSAQIKIAIGTVNTTTMDAAIAAATPANAEVQTKVGEVETLAAAFTATGSEPDEGANDESGDYGTAPTSGYDNVNSLVGFVGRNYPNTRIFFVDMKGETKDRGGVKDMCHDRENATVNGKRVAYFLDAQDVNNENDFGRWVAEMSRKAVSPSVSKLVADEVCKAKYGVEATDGLPPELDILNHPRARETDCDKMKLVDVGMPADFPSTLNPAEPPTPPSCNSGTTASNCTCSAGQTKVWIPAHTYTTGGSGGPGGPIQQQ